MNEETFKKETLSKDDIEIVSAKDDQAFQPAVKTGSESRALPAAAETSKLDSDLKSLSEKLLPAGSKIFWIPILAFFLFCIVEGMTIWRPDYYSYPLRVRDLFPLFLFSMEVYLLINLSKLSHALSKLCDTQTVFRARFLYGFSIFCYVIAPICFPHSLSLMWFLPGLLWPMILEKYLQRQQSFAWQSSGILVTALKANWYIIPMFFGWNGLYSAIDQTGLSQNWVFVWMLCQFGGIASFCDQIKKSATGSALVDNGLILIKYEALDAFARWRAQQTQSIEKNKLAIGIITATLVVFVSLGLMFAVNLRPQQVRAVLGQAVNTELQHRTFYPTYSEDLTHRSRFDQTLSDRIEEENATQNFLTCLGLGAVFLCCGGLFFLYIQPTHVGFDKTGWRFFWLRKQSFLKHSQYFRWDDIAKISMESAKNKAATMDQRLCFEMKWGRVHKLKLGAIDSIEDREKIIDCIKRWAPTVSRDAAVIQALQPPADHSYTEIWMQALSAPPKRERLKPLSKGTALKKGAYKIVDLIGTGGQGQAYLAEVSGIAQDRVVLKEFILPVFVDMKVRKTALEQFENEARILRQLDHNQIVKLMDFFVEDHRAYLVLEHIKGTSLQELVKGKGKMSEPQVRKLALQMCGMLKYLHSLSPPVVHRDFTPDNLILNVDGTLKLIDFNVAKQVVESGTSGTVVGKHAYLPPEQFRGMPERASDIYSMGATLHFLLTGSDPEPISVSHPAMTANVSHQLNSLVEKATALDLKKRYRTIEELEADLLDG